MKTTNLPIKALLWLFASMIFLFANHANATCSGNTTISTAVTSKQSNSTNLCSLNIDSSGSISTSGVFQIGIQNIGTIATLNNSGSIVTYNFQSWGIQNVGTITTLNNLGSISSSGSDSYAIYNLATITTLNNLQGASGSALNFRGNLPTNYNIIINSPTDYGQLSSLGVSGSMAFGIHSTSTVAAQTYSGILKGFTNLTNITGTTGSYNGFNYSLVADSGNTGWWNLVFFAGPSVTDTQASLSSLAPKLRGGFSSQAIATNFANMNTYDCDLFDAKGVCVSVGGQQTYVDNPSGNRIEWNGIE